ncbi:MAG TPA: tol-pal system protein YbgF [Gammaproteobacteria bacterium]|nr:tol-pal system protein YbgF [Gammaproteobacteria bacterium]
MHKPVLRLLWLVPALGVSLSLMAAEPSARTASLEARLERIERQLDNRGLVDILVKLETLQNEVRKLRGENEVLAHKLEEMKKRQRDLYIDLDRRLVQLERGGRAAAPVAPAAATTPGTVETAPSPNVVPGGKPTTATRRAPPPAPPAPVVAAASETEQQAYQQAFNLLRELKYDKASKAFREFLDKYPDGRYAHIAQYWLAETNYAQRRFKQAIGDYQTLIDKYPDSPKLAEALLKIGYSQYELKNYAAARESLERLIASYPGTTEAGQARNLLQKIRLKTGK